MSFTVLLFGFALKGNRYKGANGRNLAAAKIQATYRMHRQRREYLEYRRRNRAAGVIAMSWIMFMKMFQVRKQLKEKRLEEVEAFRLRTQVLHCLSFVYHNILSIFVPMN